MTGAKTTGSTRLSWGGVDTEARLAWRVPRAGTPGTLSFTNGRANTLAMEADDPSAHPAGMYCLSFGGDERDDWYLPACEELLLAWTNRNALTDLQMTEQEYYSSTRAPGNPLYARRVLFSTGAYLDATQTTSENIRPVRRIKIPD